MTYSCTDFTDSIIDALDVEIPDESNDSPSDQADICLAEIGRLKRYRDALRALVDCYGVGSSEAQFLKNVAPLMAEAKAIFDGPRLFNCCTDDMPPDWSKFRSLEVGGCIDHDGSTEGGVPDDKAEFWTVYARDLDNLAEAITDTKTRDKGGTRAQADALAAELSALSGLEVLS